MKDGRRRRTAEGDRKGVILDRVWHFVQTGTIPEETRFRAAVVCFSPLPKLVTANDRLFYGQYEKTNATMMALLRGLTQGRFQDGALARIVARSFWSRGQAPTFAEYAEAWLHASDEHTSPRPEWAYLSDRSTTGLVQDWKKLRAQKASRVLEVLDRISRA